jgi:hypothetical protein
VAVRALGPTIALTLHKERTDTRQVALRRGGKEVCFLGGGIRTKVGTYSYYEAVRALCTTIVLALNNQRTDTCQVALRCGGKAGSVFLVGESLPK